MELNDLILLPLFFILILVIGLIIQELRYKHDPSKIYFIPGLVFKLLGAIFFAAIHKFYYNGGDTLAYYDNASVLLHHLFYHKELGLDLLLNPAGSLNIYLVPDELRYFYGNESTFMVVRMAAFIGIFTFNSFWATSMVMGALSFSGLWALYRVFTDRYPQIRLQMAISAFFIPSVFFWGSGLMKDTLTIAFLGWLVYGFYHLCIKRDQYVVSVLLILISSYFLLVLKFYILLAFIPAAIYWVLAHFQLKIKDIPLRITVTILGIGMALGVLFFFRGSAQTIINALVGKFISMAMGFQTWHEFLADSRGQSGYSLGEISFTPMGILSKMPAAINVTLFRPYLFEVRNPVMLITAMESFAMLLFTLYILVKVGLVNSFRFIQQRPMLGAFILFALIFAFIVGFTSYNFGALARYKIPCLPFYVASLFLLLEHHWQQKKGMKQVL